MLQSFSSHTIVFSINKDDSVCFVWVKLLILIQRYSQACGLDARYDKKGNVDIMQNCGVFESLCPDLFPLIWQGTQACELYCHVLSTLLLLSTIRNRNKY